MGTGVLVVLDEELAQRQGEDLLCVVIRARVSNDVVHNRTCHATYDDENEPA
jgi:hypothetical protein